MVIEKMHYLVSWFTSSTPNPVLLQLGGFSMRWYGLALAVAVVASWFLLQRLNQRQRLLSVKQLDDLAFWTVLWGLIGGRLYHVLNEPAYYWANPLEVVAVWHGGLAIHGALLGGLMYLWWWGRKTIAAGSHVGQPPRLFVLLDLLAPAVALGQGIGRWGNYFNQELFGRATSLPWGVPIDPMNRPEALAAFARFHPVFLYEFLWDVALAAFLVWWGRRHAKRPGEVFALYVGLVSLGRFLVELLRVDDVPLVLGLRLPLLVSLGLAIASLIGWAFWRYRQPPLPR